MRDVPLWLPRQPGARKCNGFSCYFLGVLVSMRASGCSRVDTRTRESGLCGAASTHAAGPSDAADVPAAPPAAPSAPPPLPVDPLLLQLADAEFQAEDDRLKAELAAASQRLTDTEAAAASAEAPLLSTFVGMGMTSDGALLLKQVKANPLDFEMDHRPVARHLAECLTARDDAAKALADVRHELEWLQDARGDREFAAMSRLRCGRGERRLPARRPRRPAPPPRSRSRRAASWWRSGAARPRRCQCSPSS